MKSIIQITNHQNQGLISNLVSQNYESRYAKKSYDLWPHHVILWWRDEFIHCLELGWVNSVFASGAQV